MPVFEPLNEHVPWRGRERSRTHLWEEAFLPVRLDTGTDYPCSASKLQDATTPSNRRARKPISKLRASLNIRDHNYLGSRIPKEEYRAVCRLEDTTLEVFSGGYWSPDLLIKAFCDLDLVFFAGHLRGHCYVQWKPNSWFPPESSVLGATFSLQEGKARIALNADHLFDLPSAKVFKECWRVLLHEMWYARPQKMALGKIIDITQSRLRNRHGFFAGTEPQHRRARSAFRHQSLRRGRQSAGGDTRGISE